MALLRRLARIALERGCSRLVLQVLDWNDPAVRFYKAMGAEHMRKWWTMRFDGDAIARLAGS